ncbi:L-rhamnose-binding lectin SML [Pleuronectes platessa]|uniref:L-rhamnose-binding lectin SML n=1 Tax=Pleuronectes platessa TaxID=8262 RepID=UPI00232A29BF|nr:L-rhamnose-binding lectin SML [Pleuronectes platessa]
MLHLSSSLLLAATWSLMTTDVSSERVVSCSDVQRLSCDSGVISVQDALYGRTDRQTCSEGRPPQQLLNTACSLPGTFDLLRTRCDGKRVCELNIDDVRTSDPCAGTFKYLETNYTCLPAVHLNICEHSEAELNCEDGQVIFLYGADYGRRDRTTCSYRRPESNLRDVLCSSPTRTVAESCNGRSSCRIRAENSVFGDPCVGTVKYLEVSYTCQYPV